MDSNLTIPVPQRLSLAEACTVGVAAYVSLINTRIGLIFQSATLAIFKDLKVPIPSPKNLPSPKQEWALVLGGASSIGKMAIQVGRTWLCSPC
jgi:NADPH:quinone reductase-like Zn-dependent oxidoreductase